MKNYIQTVLDLPQMVNQKYLNLGINESIDSFDSESGVRSYVASIYQLIALALVVSMEYNVINAALEYFKSSTEALNKVLSVLTILVLLVSAFPMAQIIRKRGDSFKAKHSSMIEFVFNDFIKTNIRLMGEIMAIVGLAGAVNLTISFISDHDLFAGGNTGIDLLTPLAPIGAFPIKVLTELLAIVGVGEIGSSLNEISSFRINTGGTVFGGNFEWSAGDIMIVLSSYLNVIIGLAMMYISLSIYTYTYGIIVSIIKWVANPFIPLLIKNK
ncbi:MAG: hypothetical protein RLZZ209_1267 [Bacteroidota bacterium]